MIAPRTTGLLAALTAILAGTDRRLGDRARLGRGVGTLRRGQTKREDKPQWLQDRLIARAEAKRARKAAQNRFTRMNGGLTP